MSWTRINIRKFIVFPWGIITCTVGWITLFEALINIFHACNISISSLGLRILFIIPLVILICVCIHVSFHFPKGSTKKQNIYVLLTPEDIEYEKYINDFIDPFKKYASSGIKKVNVILPSLIKRDAFSFLVKCYETKNKRFWESKLWKLYHKRLRGALYIYGTLKTRTTKGRAIFAISITPTIGYMDINKELISFFVEDASKQIPSLIPIDREYEIEGFNDFSRKTASISEYLLAWAHLISGNIGIAFDMHYDLAINNKPSFDQNRLITATKDILCCEIKALEHNCKVINADQLIERLRRFALVFPDSDFATVSTAKWIVKKAKSREELLINAKEAYIYLSKVKINSHNRSVIHANRAYICLLLGRYKEAEKEYMEASKKIPDTVVDEIIQYCDEAILSVDREHEKATAYYVSALIQQLGKKDPMAVKAAYNKALIFFNNRLEYEYYISKSKKALEDL